MRNKGFQWLAYVHSRVVVPQCEIDTTHLIILFMSASMTCIRTKKGSSESERLIAFGERFQSAAVTVK
jgi:hypothetical protein